MLRIKRQHWPQARGQIGPRWKPVIPQLGANHGHVDMEALNIFELCFFFSQCLVKVYGLVVKMLVPELSHITPISNAARFISNLWSYNTFVLAKSRRKYFVWRSIADLFAGFAAISAVTAVTTWPLLACLACVLVTWKTLAWLAG